MQNACKRFIMDFMVSITIRNVPDSVRDAYAAKARRRGMSLQEYLLAELTQRADVPTVEEWLDEVEERLARTHMSFSVDEILAARDEARRG